MTRSRDSRRDAARAREQAPRSRWLLPVAGAAVVIVAAVAAIALTGGAGDPGSSSPRPSASSGSSSPAASAGAPTVTGASLSLFEQIAGDQAIGNSVPAVDGTDFNGQPVTIAPSNGKPKVLLFLAHWCSHCQVEVPLVQSWIDAGDAPDGVDIISVATGIDPSLPNYPPEEWLAREGWTVPVIVDRTGAVATAYGLSAFPFWVFVAADGTVTGRTTGELPIADLQTIIASLPR